MPWISREFEITNIQNHPPIDNGVTEGIRKYE
jgi:hypothetical protein